MNNSQYSIEENRRILQDKLEAILGSKNVYFQPPESVKLRYPAIVYEISNPDVKYANNKTYLYKTKYNIKYIRTAGADDMTKKIVDSFQMIRQERTYISDNLYHTSYNLYF